MDRVEKHRHAAETHAEAASRHEEAAAYWRARGDLVRADLESRNVEIERLAAQLEIDKAAVEEADPLPDP